MKQRYIMQHADEPMRIRSKTSSLLIRHHLDWIGFRSAESLVDFGCATGEVVREAAVLSAGGRIVGLDADPMMLQSARTATPPGTFPNVEYAQARIAGYRSTPLEDGTFDHAWTRFFLEYQKDVDSVIEEMVRVVKPGGKVNLIDLSGNCVWHFPLPGRLQGYLEEVLEDLRTTGFDPHVGARLNQLARRAGLVDIRESVEPYHRIVGRPDEETADQWKRKLHGLKCSYSTKLFPQKKWLHSFFDEMLEFILSPDTMTWSNLHLVQGVKP
jgi:ubiquinone/menaquinone biosynthesis C-methylase UbiE